MKRITKNQVIIDSDETSPKTFENEKQIENFLKKHSKSYKSIFSLQKIGQGGFSIVCRLETQELEELVAKIPMLKSNQSESDENDSQVNGLNYFQNSLYEHQILTVRGNPNFTPQIKEEVIEFNKKLGVIIRYVVIIERAQNDLQKLWWIWKNQEEALSKRDFYSPEKLAYYCFQSMRLVNYLHSRNIYHGDIKPSNLLVFRNQLVKMGDFGTAVKVDRCYWNQNKTQPNLYEINGFTEQYTMPIMTHKNKLFTKQQLFINDRYALHITFSQIYESMIRSNFKNKSQLLDEMMKDLTHDNPILLTLNDVVIKYSKYFASNNSFALKLCDQMIKENKLSSIREILLITNYSNVIQGLLNLASQQKDNLISHPGHLGRAGPSCFQDCKQDPGEDYNVLNYHEDKNGDFTFENTITPQSRYYTKFSKSISWNYEEDKQDLDIQDPLWKKMAILLLMSCDERNDECLKFQIRKRCQQIFKVGNIKLDVALEYISKNMSNSFYEKDYSDEDLHFFFDYIKANNPKPKILHQLEGIFQHLQKNDILVEIFSIQVKQLFDAQKYELAEQKAQKCLELSKNGLNREDLQMDCYLVLAYYQARKQNIKLSQRMIEICNAYIMKNYGKSSQQYLQLKKIKALIQIDKKDYYRALQCEEERLVISRNMYGDPADETIQCYLSTGLLHLKMFSQDQCVDSLEKYAKLQMTSLKGYIYLYECYHEFNLHQKLKELVSLIKEQKIENDLVYLAFLQCRFVISSTKTQFLTKSEKSRAMNILSEQKERWQYIMQTLKFKNLYLGALMYCKKYLLKQNESNQNADQNILWINQIIDRALNDQIVDKKDKVKTLEQAFEKLSKTIENKMKYPLMKRRSILRINQQKTERRFQ